MLHIATLWVRVVLVELVPHYYWRVQTLPILVRSLPSVEGLSHSTSLASCLVGQQEVVLEYVSSVIQSTHLGRLAICDFCSVLVHVLNKTRVCLCKTVRWLFSRVVKPWSRCVWPGTEVATWFVFYAIAILIMEANLRISFIDWTVVARKLWSVISLSIGLVQSVSSTVSSRLALTTCHPVHTLLLLGKCTHVYRPRSCSLERLIPVIHMSTLVEDTVVLTVQVVLVVHRIASSSVYSLLFYFSLSHSLWYASVTPHQVVNCSSTWTWTLVEVLACHHHVISVGWFPWIIDHTENWVGVGVSCPSSWYMTLSVWSVRVVLVECVEFTSLMDLVCSWFGDKVSVEHRLSHLLWVTLLASCLIPESTHTSLVEYLLLLLLRHIWEHFMDSRVVGWLKHYPILSGIHFIYAKRSVLAWRDFFLLPHSVCHEESLVFIAISKPIL